MRVPENEIEFTFVRSSGPGGQAVNKVSSKARLRWNVRASVALPPPVKERFLARFGGRLTTEGDLLLTSDRYRDRLQNERDCWEKLQAMIDEVAAPPTARKKTKPGRGARERRKRQKSHHSDKKKQRSRKWD
jgi:ribosome-associated protein